ncbi:MAG: AAA family ATPase [Saprospiraceae bacterium]|nr:AAA family ATPase [Saprospiraceae bacterium]
MESKINLDYVVLNDFKSVSLINKSIEIDKTPILFIKSFYIKSSSGKGLYDYYKNQFYDSNHKLLEDNSFSIYGIKCTIINDDYWGNLKGNSNSMLMKISIIDRLGIDKEKIFDMGFKSENRFKELFNYLSMLIQVDTHNACEVLMNKNLEIDKLNQEIIKLQKVSLFDHFQHINLTNDQHHALEKLQAFLESDERVFILQGYAGSGKTTLLKGFVEYLLSLEKIYQLMAPTGRAAKVINQKTGFVSTTIHKGIYSFEELQEIKQSEDENDVTFLYQYKIRNNPEVHDSVLIVDEASMVSDFLSHGEFFRFGSGHLLRDLITYGRIQDPTTTSKLIFIGDPAQLPPIGMNFSPALDPQYLEDSYKVSVLQAEMKEVKRQDANNGILISATKIRQCLTSGYFNDFDLRENNRDIFNPDYQDYLETYKAQLDQKIIICYKNKTALDLNRAIRRDKFGDDIPIQASETIIIGGNNYRLGIMNGEFAVVIRSQSIN